jgi:hypothetical protein
VAGVARQDRDGQYHQREDANDVRGQELMKRESKPGDARQNGGDKEKGIPAVEPPRGQESEHHGESRADSDQTDHYVDESVGRF